jgi:hypothetical protein
MRRLWLMTMMCKKLFSKLNWRFWPAGSHLCAFCNFLYTSPKRSLLVKATIWRSGSLPFLVPMILPVSKLTFPKSDGSQKWWPLNSYFWMRRWKLCRSWG